MSIPLALAAVNLRTQEAKDQLTQDCLASQHHTHMLKVWQAVPLSPCTVCA